MKPPIVKCNCPSPEHPCMCHCHLEEKECYECMMGRHKCKVCSKGVLTPKVEQLDKVTIKEKE